MILTLQEAAKILNVDLPTLNDLIQCGDLAAIGSNKQLIKKHDLDQFIGLSDPILYQNNSSVDFSLPQRYPTTCYSQIEDISESEWNTMANRGSKEHTPYFDKNRNKWCIALSLGKNSEGKRIRKIISADSQEGVWIAYREYIQTRDDLSPIPNTAPIIQQGYGEQWHLPTFSPNQDVLVSECFSKFLKGLENTVTNRTYGGYISISKIIVEKLGDLKMYELNRKIIQSFLNDLRNTTYTKGKKNSSTHYFQQSSINQVFNLLHKFIKEYSSEDSAERLLERDFMANMKKPRSKAIKSSEVIPYTNAQMRAIFQAVEHDPMISCWVHILAQFGCRPSEALALTWNDIDEAQNTILFCKALGKEAEFDPVTHKRLSKYRPILKDLKNENGFTQKNNMQIRRLKLGSHTLSSIQKWRDCIQSDKTLCENKRIHGTENFIFTGRDGALKIYEDYLQRYKRLLVSAGLKPSLNNLYRFRHTVCTDMCRRGVSLKEIQLTLGDRTSDMILKVYSNIQKEDILNGSSILTDRMGEILCKGQTLANT